MLSRFWRCPLGGGVFLLPSDNGTLAGNRASCSLSYWRTASNALCDQKAAFDFGCAEARISSLAALVLLSLIASLAASRGPHRIAGGGGIALADQIHKPDHQRGKRLSMALNLPQIDTSAFPGSDVGMNQHSKGVFTEDYLAKGTSIIPSLEQTEVGSFLAACVGRQRPCSYYRLDHRQVGYRVAISYWSSGPRLASAAPIR